MHVLILDGSMPGASNSAPAQRLLAALQHELHGRGWDYEHILLHEQKIGACAGDFFCWMRSPGVCNINDDNRKIAAAVVNSDLLVYLTPLTFGGYSSGLKQAVDHQIQNISPFFASIDGEIHHQPRYPHYPNLLALGWLEKPDPSSEAIFRHLVQRNAINMYAATQRTEIVYTSSPQAEIDAILHNTLDALENGRSSPPATLPESPAGSFEPGETQRAVLLVGSPRGLKSSSHALGSTLMAQLQQRGFETQTIPIYPVLHSAPKMSALLQAVSSASLVVLAFPLYVDSLPGPVMALLERIAAARQGAQDASPGFDAGKAPGLAAITNCGFPEAAHTHTALAICAQFARQAGFLWAGALALGGGEGLVHGTPLAELGGRAIPLIRSLELAATHLALGQPIPTEAAALMARPVIPGWLYRLAGGYGWKQQAKRYGAEKNLRATPYR